MKHVPFACVVVLLVLSNAACSVIVAGKLSGKSEDGGTADGSVDTGIPDTGIRLDGAVDEDGGVIVASCAGVADGVACELPSGIAAVCVATVCTESSCGDMIIDARTEACDDGNPDPRDGCEPESCAFTCALDTDCNDLNECNGPETCLLATHLCTPGDAPAPATPCTQSDGASGECNAALVCGPAGCGNGMPSPGEDCDDGNTIDGDGCDNDCTYSCETAMDCDDSDACTVGESCTSGHTCEPGTMKDCADTGAGAACTADKCDSVTGCFNPILDGDGDGHGPMDAGCGDDCDDGQATVYGGASEICMDGLDNDCNGTVDDGMTTWYADCDGDGFAASTAGSIVDCVVPSTTMSPCDLRTARGWTATRPALPRDTDCYDGNADARPDQALYFTSAAPGRPPRNEFDYNCDGTQEPQYTREALTTSAACVYLRGNCSGASYWTLSAPACGVSGTLSTCDLSSTGLACSRVSHSRTDQPCR